ncbi:iron-containing redox enzyme family protein [Aquincola sp. S2]|uniref:Iron-containing redox enzyme family protein n=1 Tax=Pseudaquabacterium terrae TaxID=2732868 RepID=A0ABX2EU55_9BURK|nr:iron-containing redox enzyme family protein [Aquabacterium terrae]NRF72193.1 iron-containing redox enzyme family protein [Aquabacterium terrae]
MDLRHALLETTKDTLIRRIRSNGFVTRCRDGQVTLDELKRFLVQQGLYSAYFTRYLCALMSNLPSNHEVLELAENLFEELGLDGNVKSTPHHLIYRNMLGRFDLTLQDAEATPGTLALIDTMLWHCRHNNPAFGLGALCLGAEALVPALYADVLAGFKACGVPSEDVDFFRIHVECDDGHAETIRDIMVSLAKDDDAQMEIMLRAGRTLVDARWNFFDDLASPVAARFAALAAA